MSTTTTTAPAQKPLPNEGHPGYKHTKLGWMPEEWEILALAKLSKRIMVGIASAATHAYRETGVLMLRNQNILEGKIDESDVLYIDEKYEHQHRKKRLLAGDVVTMRTGYPGVSAVVPAHLAGSQCFTSLITRPIPGELDSHFLAYYINSPIGKKIVGGLEIGGAQKNLNSGSLERLPVVTPPLPEQRRIAEVLGAWDRAIATAQQLLAAQQQRKRGLMQELLSGKKRFPGFEGKWKEVRLGELAKVDARSLGSTTPDEYQFNYISLSEVEPGKLLDQVPLIRYKDAPSRARRIVRQGDILMSTVRPNLQGFVHVAQPVKDTVASTGFAVLSPKPEISGEYLYNYLFSDHITSQINALITGSNYPSIGSGEVQRLKVKLPERKEQDKIASVLLMAEKEIHALNSQITHLTTQKRGLMQVLLTGTVRVSNS